MGPLDFVRQRRSGESTRRLALDVAVRAADLTDRRVPDDWEHLGAQGLLEAARTSLTAAAERIREDERRLAALREDRATDPRPKAEATDRPVSPPPIARELIEVADRLAVLDSDDREDRPAVTTWLEGRITEMLRGCEVLPIREEGPVNPSRHEVVGVRPAPEDEHDGRIAETVRPGYKWRDQVLRPQQVVAYVRAGDQ